MNGSKLRKLNNSRGMSILYALMYLFVLTILGALVLSAASASLGTLKQQKEAQQNYFLVESAARLLRDDMNGAKAVFAYKEKVTVKEVVSKIGDVMVTSELPPSNPEYVGASDPYTVTAGSIKTGLNLAGIGEIASDLETRLESKVNPGASIVSGREGVDISFSSAPGDKEASKVSGKVTIASDYSLTVELWIEPENTTGSNSENTTKSNRLKLHIPASVSGYDGDTEVTVSDPDSGAEETENWTRTTTYTTDKYLQVEWGKASIYKAS